MEIKYDIPIEVTEIQYRTLMDKFSGVVAGRKENGKYYIKVWFMKYAKYVKQYLDNDRK